MKKWLLLFLAAIFAFSFTPAKAKADVFTGKGVKLYIGGKANIRPSYYYDVDLEDNDQTYYLPSWVDMYISTSPPSTAVNVSNKRYKDGVIWEGGKIRATDFVIEGEVRLIFKAWGDKWGFLLIPEQRFIYNKRIADRDYPTAYEGTQWGIEKLRLWYYFAPWFKFATGWFDPDTWLDPVGTFVYANDDPYIKFYGDITRNLYWEFVFMDVYEDYGKNADDVYRYYRKSKGDWYVYWLKMKYKFKSGNLSGYIAPFVAYSDFDYLQPKNNLYIYNWSTYNDTMRFYSDQNAQIWYPGIEGKFNYGKWTFAFDVATAQGNWDSVDFFGLPQWPYWGNSYYGGDYGKDDIYFKGNSGDNDIDAWAWMWYIKYNYSKAFQPFVGMYYWSGDDDLTDDDIEGWTGIGNGEMLAEFTRGPFSIPRDLRGIGGALSSGLYSYQPMAWIVPGAGQYTVDKIFTTAFKEGGMAGVLAGLGALKAYNKTYGYYGAMTGVNPGAYFVGLGAQGAIGKWSYKAYGYYYWMDEEDLLEDLAKYIADTIDHFGGNHNYAEKLRKVDIDSGLAWGFDSVVTYKFNNNFKAGFMFELIDPVGGLEDWIEDVLGGDATTGFKATATLTWKF